MLRPGSNSAFNNLNIFTIAFSLFFLATTEVGFLRDISITPSTEIAPRMVIEVLRANGTMALAVESLLD